MPLDAIAYCHTLSLSYNTKKTSSLSIAQLGLLYHIFSKSLPLEAALTRQEIEIVRLILPGELDSSTSLLADIIPIRCINCSPWKGLCSWWRLHRIVHMDRRCNKRFEQIYKKAGWQLGLYHFFIFLLSLRWFSVNRLLLIVRRFLWPLFLASFWNIIIFWVLPRIFPCPFPHQWHIILLSDTWRFISTRR